MMFPEGFLAFGLHARGDIFRDISRFPAVPFPRQQRDFPDPVRGSGNLLIGGTLRVFFKEPKESLLQ